jgi:hypothetical protein
MIGNATRRATTTSARRIRRNGLRLERLGLKTGTFLEFAGHRPATRRPARATNRSLRPAHRKTNKDRYGHASVRTANSTGLAEDVYTQVLTQTTQDLPPVTLALHCGNGLRADRPIRRAQCRRATWPAGLAPVLLRSRPPLLMRVRAREGAGVAQGRRSLIQAMNVPCRKRVVRRPRNKADNRTQAVWNRWFRPMRAKTTKQGKRTIRYRMADISG